VVPVSLQPAMLRTLGRNLLKGVGLALFVATGFSGWITVLRITTGTAAFDQLDTTYEATVALYYGGGLVAGILLGLLWPLHRWPLGSALLGILGMFPLYVGVELTKAPRSDWLSGDNIANSLLLAFLAGAPLGLWIWVDDHPQGPMWLDALRYPTGSILPKVWIAALLIAGVSYFGVSRLSGSWPPVLVLLSAFVLFVGPIALAVLVTLRAGRQKGS